MNERTSDETFWYITTAIYRILLPKNSNVTYENEYRILFSKDIVESKSHDCSDCKILGQ